MFPAMLPNPEKLNTVGFPSGNIHQSAEHNAIGIASGYIGNTSQLETGGVASGNAGQTGDLETRHIVLYNTGHSVDADSFQLIDICKQTDIQISGFDTVFLRGNVQGDVGTLLSLSFFWAKAGVDIPAQYPKRSIAAIRIFIFIHF